MRKYLKQRAADCLLCICLSATMVSVVCSGFVLEDVWSGNVAVIFILCAILQLLLLLIARSRLTTGIGIAVGAIAAIGVAVYLRTYNPFAEEGSNSAFIFLLISVLASVLIFLLGRSRAGIVVLFVLGNMIQAGSHFLQFPAPLWSFLLFLLSVSILFFYRIYIISAVKADVGRMRITKYLSQVLLLCLSALLLAGGLYAGVIRPLEPPTQELKLITVLKSMEQLKVLGVSTVRTVLDPEKNSAQPPDQSEFGEQQGEDPSDVQASPPPPSEVQEDVGDTQEQNTDSDLQQIWTAIRYGDSVHAYLWLLLLIPLLLALALILRLLRRKRWRERVRALPKEEAVVNYYQFFLKRLERLGLKRAKQHTLREYVSNMGVHLEPFGEEHNTFSDLTAIYEKVFFGRCPVSDEDYQRFEAFYDSFYHCIRKELGTLKYCFTVFRY